MVTRRYLRIKVFQAIYGFEKSRKEELVVGVKKLDDSVNACQTLAVYFLTLLPEIVRYRLLRLEELKEKNLPTDEDLNPNTKFIENKVIAQIENNEHLAKYIRTNYIDWSDRYDFVTLMYNELVKDEHYIQYLKNPVRTYTEDKELALHLLTNFFANSELLHWFLEEKNVHWFDDYNDALLIAYQHLSRYKEEQLKSVGLSPILKDDEDAEFYKELFIKTLLFNNEYQKRIDSKLQNWESERLMEVDTILLKMAICELMQFPSIPVKVTINEYIEIAKMYSSHKSGMFINGVLDVIMLDLRNENLLHKTGRGLFT